MEYRRTAQRNMILEVLQSTDTHPTASWVYDNVRQYIPNISLGTIYRNLNVLVSQGQIQKISCGEAEDRYDATTEPHIHHYCTDCGCVSDVHDELASERLSILISEMDADVQTYSLICYGKCKHCEKKNKCN